LDRYSHVGLFDLAGALDRLPSILGPEQQTFPLAATGTDPRAVDRALTTPMRFPAPAVMDGEGTGPTIAPRCHAAQVPEMIGHDGDCGPVNDDELRVKASGFEPETYGLKVRCSTS